jgi:hypothetical protein
METKSRTMSAANATTMTNRHSIRANDRIDVSFVPEGAPVHMRDPNSQN